MIRRVIGVQLRKSTSTSENEKKACRCVDLFPTGPDGFFFGLPVHRQLWRVSTEHEGPMKICRARSDAERLSPLSRDGDLGLVIRGCQK
jgi:hypothetical protein